MPPSTVFLFFLCFREGDECATAKSIKAVARQEQECVARPSVKETMSRGLWLLSTALLFLPQLQAQDVLVHETSDSQEDDCSGADCCGDEAVRVDGVCLPKQGLMTGCWVSAQCSAGHSACRRPSGRLLSSLHADLWQASRSANDSSSFVPGKCLCTDAFVLRATAAGDSEVACVPRTIGGPCRSNYECGRRTRFSVCTNKKCVCISPDYHYEHSTDQCVADVSKAACDNGSCPFLSFGGTYGELCFYGFSASMTLVLAFWLTFCFCSHPDTAAGTSYEPVHAEMAADRDRDKEFDLDMYGDEPPSYEAATRTEVKRKISQASAVP